MVEMFSVASVSLFLILLGFADQCQFIEHSCEMHSRPAEAATCKKKQRNGEFLRGHTDQRSRSKNKIKGAFHVLIKGKGGVGSRQHNILQLCSIFLDLLNTRLGKTSRKTTFSVNEELRLYFLLVVVVRKFNNLS